MTSSKIQTQETIDPSEILLELNKKLNIYTIFHFETEISSFRDRFAWIFAQRSMYVAAGRAVV